MRERKRKGNWDDTKLKSYVILSNSQLDVVIVLKVCGVFPSIPGNKATTSVDGCGSCEWVR